MSDWSDWQRDYDLDLLRLNAQAAEASGRQLTYRDWRASEAGVYAGDGRAVTAETMRRRHGSWNEAKRLAGATLATPGPRRVWTRRAIVLALVRYRAEFGWIPTKRDLERPEIVCIGDAGVRRFPDPKTVRLRFGSLGRAQRIAAWLYARDPARWQTIPLG